MPDITIATFDFTAGLKLKNLTVGKMTAHVTLADAPDGVLNAIKKDKLITQRLGEAAFGSLEKARSTFQSAVHDIDDGFTKKPPANEAEAEERVKTLNTVSRQILTAQEGAAAKAAMAEWDKYVKKNKDMTKFKVFFAVKTTLNAISIGASVAAAVASVGILAVTIIGAAKSVASMINDCVSYLRDMETTEAKIIESDLVASRLWTDQTKSGKKVGRELATALGVPFVNSITGMSKLLLEYNAKNAMKDKVADKAWSKAKSLMADIEKAEKKAGGATKEKLEAIGAKVTEALDKIHEMAQVSKSNEQFYATYRGRYETYKEMKGKALGRSMKGTNLGVLATGLALAARTLVEVGTKLA